MLEFLFIALFLLSLIIQIIFHAKVGLSLYWHQAKQETEAQHSVSVVVCAHNEQHNLARLVPSLMRQEYTNFEVIIVNDRSTDGSQNWLEAQAKRYDNLQSITILATPSGFNPKKYALKRGIEAAKGSILLLTDADCLPASSTWIQKMQSHFKSNTEVVLGVGLYQQAPTWLNAFIQFETFYTAWQYLGFAKMGIPYMGVGRNLAYKKSIFEQKEFFFDEIKHITGGDDDLWIGKIAHKDNTTICLDKAAFTYSLPKETFKSWFKQKQRHLSVGKHYAPLIKLYLGALHLSQAVFWVSSLGLFYKYLYPFLNGGYYLILLFLLREVVLMASWAFVNKKYHLNLVTNKLLFLDLLYIFYIFITSISAFSKKNIPWN